MEVELIRKPVSKKLKEALQEKYGEKWKVMVGDTVTFRDAENRKVTGVVIRATKTKFHVPMKGREGYYYLIYRKPNPNYQNVYMVLVEKTKDVFKKRKSDA